MNKVTTINLGGKAYQLEENGYEILRQYLETAKDRLADDPDRDEVVKDFEQAIAEKCDAYITTHKNVVTTKEVEKIIEEMGPVHAEHSSTAETETVSSSKKRFYRILDGAWIGGVCNGLAAYFNIDVRIVRLVFFIFTLMQGIGAVIYIILMIIIPAARTNEEKATARGEKFNAQEFFTNIRQNIHYKPSKPDLDGIAKGFRTALQIIAGFAAVIGMIVLMSLCIAWIAAVWSIFASGALFGWPVLLGASAVLLAIFISSVFYLIIWPLQVITTEAWRFARNITKPRNSLGVITRGILWGVAIAIIAAVVAGSFAGGEIRHFQSGKFIRPDGSMICVGDIGDCDAWGTR